MTILKRVGFLLAGMTALLSFANAAESELSAQESVDVYISALFERVMEVKSLYETDQDQFFVEIELALSEFVDFREVARGVMAKYGAGPNGASAEQLDRFSEIFKDNMVGFYGSALSSYNGGNFEFLESRSPPRNPENATSVRMSVDADNNNDIEVQYIMFLDEDRVWKLKNLYVEGINLRRQYYSQFDSLMMRNDYDIEKVIELWSDGG